MDKERYSAKMEYKWECNSKKKINRKLGGGGRFTLIEDLFKSRRKTMLHRQI